MVGAGIEVSALSLGLMLTALPLYWMRGSQSALAKNAAGVYDTH